MGRYGRQLLSNGIEFELIVLVSASGTCCVCRANIDIVVLNILNKNANTASNAGINTSTDTLRSIHGSIYVLVHGVMLHIPGQFITLFSISVLCSSSASFFSICPWFIPCVFAVKYAQTRFFL